MFRDDYKSVNDKITASSELKKLTLEKMIVKQEPKSTTYMRYGLVCASFLFVVAIFPVLYGSGGLTSNESNPKMIANNIIGRTMPQTGVDEATVYQDDGLFDKYHKTTAQIQEELRLKKLELDALIKEQQAPITEEKAEIIIKEKYAADIKKIEAEVKSIIIQAGQLIPADKIDFNELMILPVAESKLDILSAEDGYYEEQWTDKQILEYLSVSPIPSYIPPDLESGFTQIDAPTQKVVFNKDGTVAYDSFAYYLCEPQLTKELNPARRTLSITVAKDKLPDDCAVYMKEDAKISILKGFELKLGSLKQAYKFDESNEPTAYSQKYIAEFIRFGVGYRIVADNLTQQEFTDVVTSIIIPMDFKEKPKTPGESAPQKQSFLK
ncbi:MAG: hypothetical protein WAX04_11955 [Oscillospiraceae bacterium]